VRELLYKPPCQNTCKERDFVFPAEKTQKRGRAHAKLLVKKHEKREVELLLLGERYCNLFA